MRRRPALPVRKTMRRNEAQTFEIGRVVPVSSTKSWSSAGTWRRSRVSPSTWNERAAQSYGSYVQGWGLSIVLHVLIGVPCVGAIVLLSPNPPEPLVMPFRWEVSIVSTTPPSIVTAALPSLVAPAPPAASGDPPPAETRSQPSDPGPTQAFPLRERSVTPPPDQGAGGEGTNQPHRGRHEPHMTETIRASVPFADHRAPEPPPPDVPPRMERSLSVQAMMAKPTVKHRPQPVERPLLTRSVLPATAGCRRRSGTRLSGPNGILRWPGRIDGKAKCWCNSVWDGMGAWTICGWRKARAMPCSITPPSRRCERPRLSLFDMGWSSRGLPSPFR